MFFDGECLCLVDFNHEFPDLAVWRERLIALGLNCQALSAEKTVTGTTIIKVQTTHALEWLRSLAQLDDMCPTVH